MRAPCLSLTTWETVEMETPARSATSLIVTARPGWLCLVICSSLVRSAFETVDHRPVEHEEDEQQRGHGDRHRGERGCPIGVAHRADVVLEAQGDGRSEERRAGKEV